MPDAESALPWGVGGALLGALAAWIVATSAAVAPPPIDFDDEPATRDDEPEPVAFHFADDHSFMDGGERVEFDVPENAAPARLEAWFSGVTAGASGRIRILAPDGAVLLESSLGPGNLAVAPGGGVQRETREGVPLAPGTYAVEYQGSGPLEGHARVDAPG